MTREVKKEKRERRREEEEEEGRGKEGGRQETGKGRTNT
jgi:hypothetical protein